MESQADLEDRPMTRMQGKVPQIMLGWWVIKEVMLNCARYNYCAVQLCSLEEHCFAYTEKQTGIVSPSTTSSQWSNSAAAE